MQFCEAAIENNLLIIPGNVFSERDTHFRIAYAASMETIERGLEVLNRLAEKHLIVYTEDKDYVPARQPSGIMVREVIEAVAGKQMLAPEAAKDDVSRRVRKTFQEIAKGMDSTLDKLSLETLIDGSDD